jgi:trk system potassium uptake protein
VVGVDAYSAVIGVWQSLGNVGYGLGPLVAATGTFVEYPDPAKWIMTASMLLGRLGLLTMVVVVLPRFWRG